MCRGMGWTVCGKCMGRGKTGCPPLAALLGTQVGGVGPACFCPPRHPTRFQPYCLVPSLWVSINF
jgi:hypothetical protein